MSRSLVEEIHYASGLSRRSVAYPDRATPLPQVPSSHDTSPYRTRTCGLRSADLRMSQVRTRPKGADRRPIKSEKAGWLNSELKPPAASPGGTFFRRLVLMPRTCRAARHRRSRDEASVAKFHR